MPNPNLKLPMRVDCSLEDSVAIFSRWKHKLSEVYVKANLGPGQIVLTGKVALVERDRVGIDAGSHIFRLVLSGATFTYEDEFEWPESARRALPEGVTPVSALTVNLFADNQLIGGAIFMELRKSS